MPLPVEFHPEADEELAASFNWYREKSREAAQHFLDEARMVRQLMEEYPQAGARYLHGTRKLVFHSLPFLLVYRPLRQRLQIIAVAHTSRKPGYWRHRL
jgi:plasmid stabilization system protein ParE